MNRFEKYWWDHGVKDTFFGARHELNRNWIQLIKTVLPWDWFKIKKQPRIMEFMGL